MDQNALLSEVFPHPSLKFFRLHLFAFELPSSFCMECNCQLEI